MMIFVYVIIGVVIGYFVFGGSMNKNAKKNEVLEILDEKDKKILALIEEKEKVTNNDIEKLLGIADSTATKYLQQLEDKGKIIQRGKTGKYTYYEKVSK
ncbi:MAG: winged helix-turn-helix transcriptional regulator [Candidatus Pacebacteria bacterium]|nr:winged helix-turn-helix transcriptional regulator [Candidatus Paceibacterota bacterium]